MEGRMRLVALCGGRETERQPGPVFSVLRRQRAARVRSRLLPRFLRRCCSRADASPPAVRVPYPTTSPRCDTPEQHGAFGQPERRRNRADIQDSRSLCVG